MGMHDNEQIRWWYSPHSKWVARLTLQVKGNKQKLNMLHQLTNLHTQPITEKKQKRPYSVNFPIFGEIKYKIWTQNSHDQAQNQTS